ncbi:fucose-specific lectin FleA [Aspergillus homomorphus CBS 101889]|uniref:Fucose-specific lectin n=1 Tax=Aspergillus homomorphus (strain CBS 101889) TaxID=1450537 RepID=A0A395HNV9_ASPHC|nr:fungal fucose-specific lectin [Aspergillus homomorphus CBS 101889]RAL09113.1 fungal fucose-specific lectin [Aspergillus homomorphus CBS 101889]
MSTSGAQQIRFRCAIAVVGSEDNFQVFTQDTFGRIRETRCRDGKWSGGTEHDLVRQGILGSPIAAISCPREGGSDVSSSEDTTSTQVHLYYIGENNVVKEVIRDKDGKWHEGNLNRQEIKVAPYSMMAACCHRGRDRTHCRLYVQMPDNNIQEFGCDDERSGWSQMTKLGRALPGTGLACLSHSSESHNNSMSIRVFHQSEDLSLKEKFYDGRNWREGDFSISKALPRTDLAATALDNDSFRVYFIHENNHVVEMVHEGRKWQRGDFHQQCVPGSQIAALASNGKDRKIRLYFQSGKHVTAVTEWMYHREWKETKEALPPA